MDTIQLRNTIVYSFKTLERAPAVGEEAYGTPRGELRPIPGNWRLRCDVVRSLRMQSHHDARQDRTRQDCKVDFIS